MAGLAAKLQLKDRKLRVLNAPPGWAIDAPTTDDAAAEAVLLFVKDRRELKAKAKPFVEAAKADQLAWVAYPKGGQLGTDLHRDSLWAEAKAWGIKPVRQVSLDDTWSALRFRPA